MAFIAPKHEAAQGLSAMPCIPCDRDVLYPVGIATIDTHRALENKDKLTLLETATQSCSPRQVLER